MKRWIHSSTDNRRTVFVCDYVRDKDGKRVNGEFVFEDTEDAAKKYLVSKKNARSSTIHLDGPLYIDENNVLWKW